MKICLLTYDTPHLKTSQVYLALRRAGMEVVDFLLVPFVKRPERPVVFRHRPLQFEGAGARALARWGGSRVLEYAQWREALGAYNHFLVCGANLLEPEFANSGKVLNVHAGLIPTVRGLDSFKWAILKQLPLGNTLHVIDEHADAGEVIAHLPTPVFHDDDIETLAARHYEAEIWMLGNFRALLSRRPVMPGLAANEPTMRMPAAVEAEMLASFDRYKDRYAA